MSGINDASPHVLVLGDMIIDHYLIGSSSRISPEAPVPVVDVGNETVSLGGAGNVMNNLLSLGAQVTAASAVGNDESGSELLNILQDRGISTAGIMVERQRQTSRKTRVVVSHQQVVRFDRESTDAISPETEAQILANLQNLSRLPDAILISDYKKGVVTPSLCQAVIEFARRNATPVLVDPKGCDGTKYRGATLMTPNKKETADLTGIHVTDDDSIRRAAQTLVEQLAMDSVVITLSEDGMAAYDGDLLHIRTAAREVFDVSGAGDTVLAALGYGLASGMSLADAAVLANDAAGIVVGKFGSATVTLDEIRQQRRQRNQKTEHTVQSFDEIEQTAIALRRQGKRVVFTNGCFDLLHRGHVEYLSESRRQGDVLIVGVNSDASVRRLKGPQRPIVAEEDRLAILAALQDVDYVVKFDQETPYELISRIKPDVLTKGADYAADEVVGREFAGKVQLIPLVGGRSTTATIDNIRRAA